MTIGGAGVAVVAAYLGSLIKKKKEKNVVMTKDGALRGSKLKTVQGETIHCFRSVPYGKPPVGDRRFKRSEPNEGWEGVRDATAESPKSLQPNILFPELLMMREGSEDCLYVNVYSKNVQFEGDQPIPKVTIKDEN